ncbi:MAG: hypothetical protein ACRCS3_12745 [Paracoccaceae bacterium]
MFSACTMAVETLAEAEGPGYRLKVMGSPNLCVDPSVSQDLWGFAATLVVTNTSVKAYDLEFDEGATAGFTFRAERVADARDPREGLDYETGPIDPAMASVKRMTLAPGAEHTFGGDPRYILEPIQLAVNGERVDGSPAAADERWDRSFRVEFLADIVRFEDGVQRNIIEEMPAILRIVVRDVTRE